MKDYIFQFKDNEVLYMQIYKHIKNLITNGYLKKDTKLISKRVYAKYLNCSINSIVNAYNILLEEGYIYSKEKSGYYVSEIKFISKDNNKQKENKDIIKQDYIYDFTTSSIDESYFLKTAYHKIAKDIIYNGNYMDRSPFNGLLSLRNTISNMLKDRKNIIVDSDQIFISSNTTTLIRNLCNLVNTTSISVENPGYYNEKNLGFNTKYINLDEEGIIIDEFLNSNSNMLIVTSFCEFPMGIKMSIQRKNELIDVVNKYNLYVIEDSFDSNFRNNGYLSTPLFNLSDRVIYIESFSRTVYSGLCISYMVLPKELANQYYLKYKDISFSVPTFEQLLLKRYIDEGLEERFENKIRLALLNKKKLLLSNINKDLFEIISTESYTHIIVNIKKNIDINKIKKEFEQKKIKINFLSEFLHNKENTNSLILGFTNISDTNIINGLKLIESILL